MGQQIAALAGLGVQGIAEDKLELLLDLKCVADPALSITLIGGELNGYVSDDRQHQKQRHGSQQHQPVCSQDAMSCLLYTSPSPRDS